MSTVSAVIAAFDEAATVAATVAAVRTLPGVAQVIVVDDGSRDDTARRAGAAGAAVVRLPCNRGKGAALEAGLAAARGEIVLLLDADLGATAAAAVRLLEPVLTARADMAVAVLPPPPRPAGWGLAVGLARLGIWLLTRRWLRAPLSGQRAVRRALLGRLLPLAPGFGVEVGLTVDALRLGARLVEVPVTMTHRHRGRDLPALAHRCGQLRAVLRTLAGRAAAPGARRSGGSA